MVTVPVVWYGDRPGILNRGYWDQSHFEDLLANRLWPVSGLPKFSHHASLDEVSDGAIVAIPARWFVAEAEEINRRIARLNWCFIILFGDEEGDFPWRAISHPNLVVWIQTAHPGQHPNTGEGRPGIRYRWIGDGCPPGCHQELARLGEAAANREYNWWFSGQLNNDARVAAVEAMAKRRSARNDGTMHVTRRFGSGLPYSRYLADLATTKVAPCPAGTYSPDTFRIFEALEAGCVPVTDRVAPKTQTERSYWETLFGGEPPFPVVDDWHSFAEIVDRTVAGWPVASNACFSWWQAKKRELACHFADDLAWAANLPTVATGGDDITVLVPTSPILSHPSTACLEETLTSIREQADLAHSDVLVMVDGVRAEQHHRNRDYQEYVRRLCWKANFEWSNVLPVVYDQWLHQAEMTRRTLPLVRTRHVLFVEHDTPLQSTIPWQGLSNAIDSGRVNLIRLHHEASILEPHRDLMIDQESRDICGVPLRATTQWSQRPHLALTEWYRWMIGAHFGTQARTMIEDVMYGVLRMAVYKERMDGFDRFKVFMYCPDGDMKRSTHLDGRAGEPKYDMLWRYDGEKPPPGAPAPQRDEDIGLGGICKCVGGLV